MTTQTILLDLYDYGASSVTITIHDPDTLAEVDSDVSDTIVTTKSGVIGCRYSAVLTRVAVIPAGVYAIGIEANGIPGLLYCTLAGTSEEIVPARAERYAVLDTAARVKLAADQPDYAPMKAPELRGDLTLAEAVDLILAGVLGVSSEPDSDSELFKFVDAVNAFTTTFDTAGNRTAVVLH